jgi:hypothetical protein
VTPGAWEAVAAAVSVVTGKENANGLGPAARAFRKTAGVRGKGRRNSRRLPARHHRGKRVTQRDE